MKIRTRATLNALATFAYIILVASFMFNVVDRPEEDETVLIPIAMLTLFVFSAALTGFLVLGKPVMLYIEGKKKDAVTMLGYTLGVLAILTIFVFLLLFLLVY